MLQRNSKDSPRQSNTNEAHVGANDITQESLVVMLLGFTLRFTFSLLLLFLLFVFFLFLCLLATRSAYLHTSENSSQSLKNPASCLSERSFVFSFEPSPSFSFGELPKQCVCACATGNQLAWVAVVFCTKLA
jgi:hypothetical protein